MALRPRLLRSGARDSPENGEPERIQNRRRKEDGSLPLTGSGDLAMIPLSELMDMIRPLTLSSLFDLERDSTMRRLGHNTEYTHGSTGIGKQLDTRVWELVQKEVMDWHDTWSTSGLRGGNLRMPSFLFLPAMRETLHPPTYAFSNLHNSFLTMVAVQLLATCFTLPQDTMTSLLPIASYHDGKQIKLDQSDFGLISSLRLHTQRRTSPAYGHQARNASTAQEWPDLYTGPSREERLAEEVSQNRRRRQDVVSSGGVLTSPIRRRTSEQSGSEEELPIQSSFPSSSRRRRFRSSGGLDATQNLPARNRRMDRIFGRPLRFTGHALVDALSHPPHLQVPSTDATRGRTRTRHALDHYRDGHEGEFRWSLQPILRSEAHPVYIQPVKEHVIRRWRCFRPKDRSNSSPSTSDDNQGRRKKRQKMTLDDSRDSPSPIPRLERSRTSESADGNSIEALTGGPLSAPALLEDYSEYPSISLTASNLTPLGAMAARRQSPDVRTLHRTSTADHASYFAASSEDRHRSILHTGLQRASTSGTTVFSPPIIAEATPNAEKLPGSSNGNGSSGSSSGGDSGRMAFL